MNQFYKRALDANQKIISKGQLFSKAWKSMYPDIIEYRPDSNVIAINKNSTGTIHFFLLLKIK